jgi:hypothetical protein
MCSRLCRNLPISLSPGSLDMPSFVEVIRAVFTGSKEDPSRTTVLHRGI